MRMRRCALIAGLVLVLVSQSEPVRAESSTDATQNSICLMLESAARAHDLPLEFFARLIWRESRFRSEVVGPRTRSGKRAQGIAQFMPATAAERGLLDPFDPVQALPKSAEFLQQLRIRFGNLGLAAAAYNAGPRRLQDWLNGTGGMPLETRDYVFAITGRSVDDWVALKDDRGPARDVSCGEMMALLKEEPTPYMAALEQRILQGTARPWGVQLAAGFSRDNALACLRADGDALWRDGRRARSDRQQPHLAQPRHASVLSDTHRHRHAHRSELALRTHSQGRRRLHGAAPVSQKMRRAGRAGGPSIVTPCRRYKASSKRTA